MALTKAFTAPEAVTLAVVVPVEAETAPEVPRAARICRWMLPLDADVATEVPLPL